jgi:hypothetical protein
MKRILSGAALILWTTLLGAQTPAQEPSNAPSDAPSNDGQPYNGTWVSPQEKDVKLVMQTIGEKIHVQEFKGNQMKWEYTCGLGKACQFKEGTHEATVSLWRNGPKLVEVRTRGDMVMKRRFTLADKGTTLDVEVLPISPPGETQTLAYSRN